MNAKKAIRKAPDKPGIYLFYNKKRELIYVGKATSLRSRIKSYFAEQKSWRPIETFFNEVSGIKWRETDSVMEATLLEAKWIKKFQPKYNVLGKDDKSWNYLVITKDKYPKLAAVRQHELKNSVSKIQPYESVFGPFPGLNTKEALKILRRLFYFSTCKPDSSSPCFYYQIKQCLGVCVGEISPREYRQEVISPLKIFLSGKKKQVLKQLEDKMKLAARNENFEEAARLRNQLFNLKKIQDVTLLNKNFVQEIFPAAPATENIRSIEGYDISNLGSTGKVGSMVSFVNGEPVKSNYKKFKIKTVAGQSDVACLAEILRRRLGHREWPLPDLILIDGGLPQINIAKKVLSERQITLPIVSIAKGRARKKNQFFMTDLKIKNWLNPNKNLLIRVRDEAHRFAIAYQRKLRKYR